MPVVIANGIISADTDEFGSNLIKYAPVLKRAEPISKAVERAKNALRGYEDYLD